jgi:large repetitive protein
MNSRLKILKISYLAALFVLIGTTLTAQMTVNVAVTNPTCNGYTNGWATANVTGGTAPYAYSWSNGQGGGQTVLGIPAGNYTVTVTDNVGTRVTRNFTAGQPTPLVGTASPVGGVCFSGAMTYQGNGSGSTPPYNYAWRNLTTNQTSNGAILNAPSAGTYHLSVTDAQNCQVTKVVNITGDLEVTIRTVPASCGGMCDGAVEARVTGGLMPYSFRWNYRDTTSQAISPVPGGTYMVTVTDANGCQKGAVATVYEAPVLEVNLVVTGKCSGAGTAKVTPTGGTPPFTITWSNGGIGNQQTNLGIGIYYVTVTDAVGCKKSEQINISNQAGVMITTNKFDATCLGINTGSATASVSGNGLGAYSFKWSNGVTATNTTTSSISNLAPGTYTVTSTDGAGCTDVATVVVNAQRTVQFSVTPTDAACGSSNGTAAVTNPNGGTAPYRYNWSNGATTPSVSGLVAGSYMVTVTDATGCYGVQTLQILGVSNINFTVTKGNSVCNSATGTIAITNVNGGVAPFTYKWSDLTGVNQPSSRTGLAAGTYGLTVSDATGCIKTSSIVINSVASFNLTGNKTDASCGNNDGTASVATSLGGVAPFTYLWSNGRTTASINNLPAGNYTVSVTDATGCVGTTTVSVFAIGNFTIGTASTNSICAGATGTASVTNVTGGVPPYTYRWNNGATTQTIINVPPGDYIAIVTDATGCQAASRTMVVGSTSPVTTTPPAITSASCTKPNGKITLTGANGLAPYTYRLGTKTNTTGVFDSLAPGKYVIIITDANQCAFRTDSLTIDDKGAVKAQASVEQLACLGDSVSVRFNNNSIGAVSYSWLFTGNRTSTETSPTLNFGTNEGDARLIARSTEGCTDTLNLRFPVAALKFTLVDSVATCTNTAVNVAVSNTGNTTILLTYKWTPTASIIGSDSSAAANIRVPAVGTVKVYVLVKNALGCSRLDSVLIKAVDKAFNKADVTFKQACDTKEITFSNNSPLALYYTWLYGNPRNPIATKDSIGFKYIFTTTGNDSLILVPKLACLDTIKIPFTVRNGPAVTVTADNDTTVCGATAMTLKATSNTNSFEWATNRNFTPVLGTGATLLVRPTDSVNVYYVRSRNADGCTGIDSVVVRNAEIKISRVASVDACNNVNRTITINNLTNRPITVVWSPTSILTSTPTTLNPTVKITADGNLIGVFSNAAGCTLRDTIPLKVRSVDASVMATANTIYVDDMVTLIATPTGSTFRYLWTPSATVTSPTSANTTAAPKETTTYTVKVTDAFGCEDTASVVVKVLTPTCAEPFVFVPRAFTPNGDGLNEKVFVRGEYLTEMEFVIFNRWGEQVFLTKDRAEGWDGTHKGTAVCPDVYGYYVKGKCKKGEDFFIKGNITVLK